MDPRLGLEILPRLRTTDPRNTRVGAHQRGFPWGGIVAAGVAFLVLALNTRVDGAEERILLSTGHVDLRIDYDAGRSNLLEILISDDDQGLEFPSTSAVLVVAESARLELPTDLPPLGSAGDSLWVVPQSQDPGIVFLGVSAEHNPAGIFTGALQLRLLDVRGPGDFFFWQSDLGSMSFFLDSSDGFGPEDSFPQLVGGHSHGNWGFTTNGVYFVTLQAVGQRIGETTNIFSPPTVLEFHVEPVPASLSPFQEWQAAHWPDTSDPLKVGPEADPDQDGRKNLEEYALGTDPNLADLELALTPTIRPGPSTEPGGVEIQLRMRRDRTDVEPHLLGAPDPTGPWTHLDLPVEEVQATGDAADQTRILLWKISFGVAPAPVRFYRVGYQLKLNP